MNAAIQSICYNISQYPEVRNNSLKRSHLHEVVAALLGYASHAALIQEGKESSQEYEFSDAEFVVLNLPMGAERAVKFFLTDEIFQICVLEVKSGMPVPVFESVEDFYDDYLREFLEKFIYDGAEETGDMADCNASFYDYPDMDEDYSISGDLWTALNEWSLEDTGTLSGEYDPEGHRMYNGHTFNVKGKLKFAKAGRAGLIFLEDESGFFLSLDESWRDEEALDI
ncbi:hypothetical protein PU707_002855 [Cronobacter sakazakii]|uniref:hypothetical protein n=1 Tax=Cronobacter sakazakii TaxID=28141 RepID=UPI001AEA728A|nr:hypothetical protein [Cronobacter sakazakii]EKK3980571.1 hypothetical protein [Cronobacter sakazakii]EKK3982625.1 hypothetical protein [Cronobacter sakazakii]EKM6345167.1 hypothetical protein [Cronobacter sakazakii]EKM6353070.1 hypothetical protein [Cronobacter sakazakii]EKM6354601.1 hypothetical protein [Cronobacter sakazakii]